MGWNDGATIVGIGETKLGKRPGWSAVELQAEAVMAAVADAGLGLDDVDALFNLGPYSRPAQMFGLTLAQYLGIHPAMQASVDAGGTWSAMMQVANCVSAVQNGQCEVAVCTFGESVASGRVVGGRGWTSTAEMPEFEFAFGMFGAVTPYAMVAARHMAEFGTTEEAFGAIAIATRLHASRNENAFRRTPFTMEEYLASPMLSTPIRLFDCSTMVDGAGAIVVTTAERARDLDKVGVEVLGLSAHTSHRDVGQFTSFDDLQVQPVRDRAFGQAGVTIDDIDVAQIHDAFTISTLVYLEELGFCPRGQGGAYALEGNLDLGARCPVNTAGGLLSQGHVAGMLHVTEAVRQLRGDGGERQVDGADVAVVAGGGGIFGVNAVMVLGRAR